MTCRCCWIRSAAGALEGKAKSYRLRSTEVAIWRDPAESTSTASPARANALRTAGSAKNASFSEPMTPRTVVVRWEEPWPRRSAITTPASRTTASAIESIRRSQR
ncbi:hypothetical protein OG417_31680 [Actinoallomurus sp. NBC_01490]|uniref:hypothetical protein n=1 Tax=Actinoallomurus sp. NBC_01490 TaxID=2903557 RepID=UPI002E377325|nr:hypothetical protein [Actinoallomurus sp. NBC_01490]